MCCQIRVPVAAVRRYFLADPRRQLDRLVFAVELYFGDERLAAFNESSVLTVKSTSTSEVTHSLVTILQWEYFDGERWRGLANPSLETAKNEVALMGPVELGETSVGEVSGLFLRGQLAEVPQSAADTLCDTVSMRLELVGEGELPLSRVQWTNNEGFTEVDYE